MWCIHSLPLHHTYFQYQIPDTPVPEAEQTASPQNKQVQRLPVKSSNDTVKDRTRMQWNMSLEVNQNILLAFTQCQESKFSAQVETQYINQAQQLSM